jgi:hypothetical protein
VIIGPRPGWQHFACLTCSAVFHLPHERGERPPWCTHNGAYSWKAPESPEEPPGSEWTQTVAVIVASVPTPTDELVAVLADKAMNDR